MPQQVVVQNWCDLCFEKNEMVEGFATEPITLGNQKPRTMLLCSVHTKEVLEPIRDILKKHGQIVGQAPKQVPAGGNAPAAAKASKAEREQGDYECPLPECDENKVGTKAVIKGHLEYHHKLTPGQANFVVGHTLDNEPLAFVCKEGGCKEHPSAFPTKLAVTQHLIRGHNKAAGSFDTAKYALAG